MGLVQRIKSEMNCIPGWRTKRKIVVIESDDWGTVRMPSRQSYNNLLSQNVPVNKDTYCRLDALECDDDMAGLCEVLRSVTSHSGQKPVFTANTIVANPVFDNIQKSGFQSYFFEPFTETLKRYPNHSNVWDTYRQGMADGILTPQLHGREHVNIEQWLQALQQNDPYARAGFFEGTFAISPLGKFGKRHNFMAALDFESDAQKQNLPDIISSGVAHFKQIFGVHSGSFIAPTYIWDETTERTLAEHQVKTLQGISFQYIPNPGSKNYRSRYQYTGKKNKFNQIYLTRNCFFEPALMPQTDAVSACLQRVEMAFRWHKPAIISSHRLNFIGFIDPANRDKNLKLFGSLLKKITQTWPDVEFMSSDQLGDLIAGKSNA